MSRPLISPASPTPFPGSGGRSAWLIRPRNSATSFGAIASAIASFVASGVFGLVIRRIRCPQLTKCKSRRAASMVVRLAMAPGSWARHQERTGRPRPLPFAFVSAFAITSAYALPLKPQTHRPMAGVLAHHHEEQRGQHGENRHEGRHSLVLLAHATVSSMYRWKGIT